MVFYNQCNSVSIKFQPSKDAHKRSAETRKGRTKETHEYIAKQIQARAKYKGNGLTPAQKAQWSPKRKKERMKKYKETLAKTMEDPIKAAKIQEARIRGGKSCKGIPNPKKGHNGLNHPKVQSWWYKDPKGNITLVNDSIRNYCKENLIFPMSAASIMRYIREKKVPDKVREQGWNFGLNDGQEVTNPVE